MNEYQEQELPMVAEPSMLATLNKSEIDQQITTAKQYPRSIVRFRKEALEMVTLNENVAGSCVYALPRDGKTIEGPSARFAEVIASAWGNGRSGARVVNEGAEFITAQGVYHDLERNSAITYEVQRRITGKKGRFSPDMIGVTANAACSIALRNAILKGIPKAFWDNLYEAARQVIRGDFRTLANRRADMLAKLQGYGMTKEQVCQALSVAGEEDIGLDEIVLLRGMLTALREGDTTPESLLAQSETTKKPKVELPQPKKPEAEQPKQADDAQLQAQATHNEQPTNVAPPPPEKPTNGNGNGNGHSEPVSEGQRKFLLGKIKAAGLSLDDVMVACGVSDFDKLTTDGFISMKEHVAQAQD